MHESCRRNNNFARGDLLTKPSSHFFLVFLILYVILVFLSLLSVASHRPGMVWLLSELPLNSEPEVRLMVAYLYPLVWVLIPFSSIVFCIAAWIAYEISFDFGEEVRNLIQASGVILFAISLAPAALVIRELIIYSPVNLMAVMSMPLGLLNGFAALTRSLLNPAAITRWGSVAVPVVIFAETGLFFGFFLPGDSLLFAIGLVASSGLVDLRTLIPLTILAAIAGNEVNYVVGHRSGHVLTRRYRFLENELDRTVGFFERHGGKTIVIARFVPIVRTFAPAVAGASNMRHSRFLLANIVGSVLWVLTVILAGYFFGGLFPQITNNLYILISVVVLGSIVFSVIAWIRGLKRRHVIP